MKLSNIIVTKLEQPITVISPKGENCQTKNRDCYGLSFCIKGQTYDLSRDKDGLFPVINFDCTGLDCSDIVVLPLHNAEAFLKDCQKLSELFLFENNRLRIYSLFYDMLHRIEQEQLPKSSVLHHALKYIAQNFSNPELSNTLIAQSMNISEVYFRKIFVGKYHQTPKQYILDIRIKKAKQLLTDSPYSVSAISELCGFSSLYAFSRCFKEKLAYPLRNMPKKIGYMKSKSEYFGKFNLDSLTNGSEIFLV